MRPDALVRMQEHLFQATADGHAFGFRQILEQGRQALLQTHGNVHALDLEGRPGELRRLAPGERLLKAELGDIEFDGGGNVADRQGILRDQRGDAS
jgi:hypothetical protein